MRLGDIWETHESVNLQEVSKSEPNTDGGVDSEDFEQLFIQRCSKSFQLQLWTNEHFCMAKVRNKIVVICKDDKRPWTEIMSHSPCVA